MNTTAPMNTSVNTVPTLATYQAMAIRMRMTRVAPSMRKPSIRECGNYSSAGPRSRGLTPCHAARMSNTQLFSSVAREYSRFRPGYPPELFAWLARAAAARDAAWDCGCGSGQASTALAEHFAQVHATDVAPEQIAAAKAHPRVQIPRRARRALQGFPGRRWTW